MIVFLNGRLVTENRALVSVQDRGFLYGDGLFETVLVWNGKLFRWPQHWARLARGANLLQLGLPYSGAELERAALDLAAVNQLSQGLLRLSVSRGVGPRGYSPQGAGPSTVVLSLCPWPAGKGDGPPQWRLHTASLRLQAGDPIAAIKASSKLLQVMARMEAEAQGADEALLLNDRGQVVEGASGNLFWISSSQVKTPALAAGGLEGITRGVLLELCRDQGLAAEETMGGPHALTAAEGVFLTLSGHGLVEVIELDRVPLRRSPRVLSLARAYWDRVGQECA
jgi:branched-chain amino acid aminotransferase